MTLQRSWGVAQGAVRGDGKYATAYNEVKDYGGNGTFSGVNTCTLNGAACSGTTTPGDTTAPTVSVTVRRSASANRGIGSTCGPADQAGAADQ